MSGSIAVTGLSGGALNSGRVFISSCAHALGTAKAASARKNAKRNLDMRIMAVAFTRSVHGESPRTPHRGRSMRPKRGRVRPLLVVCFYLDQWARASSILFLGKWLFARWV